MADAAAQTPVTPQTPAGDSGGAPVPVLSPEGAEAPKTPEGGTPGVLGSVGDEGKAPPVDAGSNAGDGEKGKVRDEPPVEFKMTLPEGVDIPKEALDQFAEVAKGSGLNGEQASAMVAYQHQLGQQAAQLQVQQEEARDVKWQKELTQDADFGGEKLQATIVAAKNALRRFGGETLAASLQELGLGNHPGLIKTFARMGLASAEDDSSGKGSGAGSGPLTRDQQNARLYDNSQ